MDDQQPCNNIVINEVYDKAQFVTGHLLHNAYSPPQIGKQRIKDRNYSLCDHIVFKKLFNSPLVKMLSKVNNISCLPRSRVNSIGNNER